jgi:hypothetical protein
VAHAEMNPIQEIKMNKCYDTIFDIPAKIWFEVAEHFSNKLGADYYSAGGVCYVLKRHGVINAYDLIDKYFGAGPFPYIGGYKNNQARMMFCLMMYHKKLNKK